MSRSLKCQVHGGLIVRSIEMYHPQKILTGRSAGGAPAVCVESDDPEAVSTSGVEASHSHVVCGVVFCQRVERFQI